MKALILEKPGTPDTLRIAKLPPPVPTHQEVRVKVMAVGLNPVDFKSAEQGRPAWKWPHILGLDVAGVIDTVGAEVDDWKPGDRVFYHGDLSKPGGFAEFAVAPIHVLAKVPGNVTFEEAAAVPCAGFTAWQILSRKIPVKVGQTLLVHGGAGGVGGFAIQLGRNLGLDIFTTCSAGNISAVKNLGAEHPIDYNNEDVTARVQEMTDNRGVDIIINTISKESATQDLDRLAFGGHLACVTGPPDFNRTEPFARAISIHKIILGSVYALGDRAAQSDLAAMGKELMAFMCKGDLSSMLNNIVSLKEVPQALISLSHRHVKGKIVARLDS